MEKEQLDHLSKIIEKIKIKNILVVVEGKKDAAALNLFGITNIIQLSKKPLYEIVENVSNSEKEVIILTDLDRKGKELYGKLSKDLQKFGVRIDSEFRDFLFTTHIRQIEGLRNILKR